MNEQQMQDQIERYLAGTMSGPEIEKFEASLEKNSNLSDAYAKNLLERQSIKHLIEEDYKDKIRGWRSQDTNIKALPARQKSKRWLSMAASILLVVSLALFFMINRENSPPWLAELYVEADDIGTRGHIPSTSPEMLEAKRAFFAGQYEEAMSKFQKLSNDDQFKIDASYYLGHAALKLNKFELAIEKFDQLLAAEDLPTHLSREKIEWNWLLAQVASENSSDHLVNVLNNFAERNPAYRDRVDRLKQEL